MDDIHQVIRGDDRRSMTYAEIAAARGISADSAVRLVRRKRWTKQAGNDGTVRVLVPVGEAIPASPRKPGGQPGGQPRGQPGGRPPGYAPADILPVILGAIREVMQPLSEQIEAANRRADHERDRADTDGTPPEELAVEIAGLRARIGDKDSVIGDLRSRLDAADRRADEDRARADRAEQRASDAERIARDEVAALQAELVEVRVSERAASERAAATAAEITELRRLLDVADRRIQGERTRAEQERELRTQAQGRLADKDATITGLVAEKQVLKQEVETLTELARARRSWWGRVFGR
jgi:uncharacterized coiled-coil DUF342 family protein